VFTQNDGSIYLIVGTSESALITRLHANGTIDSSYGYYGYSKLVSFDIAKGALQTDGKIVVAGTSSEDFALARYNTDGSLDTTFAGDGKLTTDFGTGNDQASAIAIQIDGKIVVVGTSSGDLALARYNTNGTLDATFSENGRQTTHFEPAVAGVSAAIQGDGKIVAGFRNSFREGWNRVRYNTDGSLDKTFSGDGIEATDFGSSGAIASIALQPDGKIVAVGSTDQSGYDYFTLTRYNTDGTLDKTFSGDGIETFASVVTIQTNGKIVAVGTAYDDEKNFQIFSVARYNTDGTPDATFSGDGSQKTDLGYGQGQYPQSVVIQNDGGILVAGTAYNDIPDFALVRYNADGTLDTTFSEDGKLLDYIHSSNTYYTSTAIQNDGKSVAAGFALNDSKLNFALARYNTDGSPDATFSEDGKQTTDFDEGEFGKAQSVAIQKDGKIVAAGLF
jgi:uncharacterized delta-60 repeat protein